METMDRRTAMALGAAILAPACLMPRPLNAETYARHAGLEIMPGVRRIDLGRWPVALPAYRAIVMTDYVVAPGAGFPPEKIRHDTIYHVLEGEFRVKTDKEFVVKAGELYVCVIGETRADANPGQLDALLRVIALKTRK
jgi:quercetin dioxygenase-like cupin family protein